jgi:hypothetical protein
VIVRTPEIEPAPEQKQPSTATSVALGVAIMPVLIAGAGLAISSATVLRWMRRHEEHSLRAAMKAQGRVLAWAGFQEKMRSSGGTCIEERFSPKGPVRFWWTQENVFTESPHKIIDWFTMQKGGAATLFVHWCRKRYTSAAGSALLVDTRLVSKKEIYALWSECRSQSCAARWVEVAPPEILPSAAGETKPRDSEPPAP